MIDLDEVPDPQFPKSDELLQRPRKRNARSECLEEDDMRVFKRVRILRPSNIERAAPPRRCHSCNRAESPEWRRGPDGARTLCNACGFRYAKLTRRNRIASLSDQRFSTDPYDPIYHTNLKVVLAKTSMRKFRG